MSEDHQTGEIGFRDKYETLSRKSAYCPESLWMVSCNSLSNWSFHPHELVHFFFNLCSTLLVKVFSSLCAVATSQSATDGYQAISLEDIWFFTDDFLRKEEDLVADIIYDGEALVFLPKQTTKNDHVPFKEGSMSPESLFEDADDVFVTEPFITLSPQGSDSIQNNDYLSDQEEHSTEDGESITIPPSEADSIEDDFHSPTLIDQKEEHATTTIEEEKCDNREDANNETMGTKISEDGKFFILETKKVHYQEKSEKEIIGDLFTDGSTSKSSSEWRNSINYRGSGTEDPFSSSSRRSCQTWESYTVYQKYDEEMMFFDRYSTQKLSEA
ncbi:Dna ligase, partial [Thalictrum thalictroides]